MRVAVLNQQSARAKAITSLDSSVLVPKGKARNLRSLYFDLRDASRQHAYLRAAISSIGRAIVGPGFTMVKHPLYGDDATDEQRETLWDFYNNKGLVDAGVREVDIKHPLTARLYKTVGAFRLFGAAFWEARRNTRGDVLGSVMVDGYVHPNVDDKGRFRDPAWLQYTSSVGAPTSISDDNMIAFMWPDFCGPAYSSDLESLVEYTLTSDFYMLLSMRELFKNMRAPFGIWSIDAEAGSDAYEAFREQIKRLYQGAKNTGKSAMTTQGMVDYKPVAQNISDVPWQQGHEMTTKETLAVTGQMGQKLGIHDTQATALQELRREYWEQTSLPITRMLSDIMWQEIHVRYFNIRGWVPQFNPPDFTTALQDASIEMRRIQWGQWSPNEARASRGEGPREDGDYYILPMNVQKEEPGGAPDPVDDADEEPKPADEEPVPDSEPPERVDDALDAYKRFLMTDVKRGKRRERKFESDLIPADMIDAVGFVIDEHGLSAEVVDAAIVTVKDMICPN